jgi:hypothetical protein
MAKDPGARFPSASALAHAASAALRDPTLQLRPPLPPVPTADVASYPRMEHTGGGPWWQQAAPRTMSGQPPPLTPKRRRRTAIGAGIGAVVLAAATTVAVAVWADGRDSGAPGPSAPSAAAPAPTSPADPGAAAATDIGPDQLRPILLTAAELPQSGGAPMALEQDNTGLADDAATVAAADQQCLDAWTPAQQAVYQTSRSTGTFTITGAAVQTLRGINQQPWQDGVVQAVVSFDSEKSAGGFYVRQRGAWELCGGKTITVTPAGQSPQIWEFAHPITTTGVYTITATLHGGTGSCQHGMMARGNVMIDIRQCRTGGADVAALAIATAAKLPHQ